METRFADLDAAPLSLRASPIWLALSLDAPTRTFSKLNLAFAGVDARLPNLDLLTMLMRVARATGIPLDLDSSSVPSSSSHGAPRRSWLESLAIPRATQDLASRALGSLVSLLSRVALAPPARALHDAGGLRPFEAHARGLATQLALGALGSPSGPEGVFARYRIDSAAICAVPSSSSSSGGGAPTFDMLAFGRMVEGATRSLNNLVERLHQSFFLYLLPDSHAFIPVSSYVAAPILAGAALTINGLAKWRLARRQLVSDGSAALFAPVLAHALALIAGVYAFALALTIAPPTLGALNDGELLFLAPVIAAVVVDRARRRPDDEKRDVIIKAPGVVVVNENARQGPATTKAPTAAPPLSPTLRALTLLLAGLTINVVSTLNFGLACACALALAPALMLAPRCATRLAATRKRLVATLALFIGTRPFVALSLARAGKSAAEASSIGALAIPRVVDELASIVAVEHELLRTATQSFLLSAVLPLVWLTFLAVVLQ